MVSAYICTPDRKISGRIKGITTFEVAEKGINDFSTINFAVQKYVTNQSTMAHEINESYAKLHAFCEIYVPEKGYFIINSEPSINSQGQKIEYKEFTASSYESVLQYENLLGFLVNQGTETSIEMDPENLDELGIPKKNIRLYDADENFSLIDLVLRDDYYGWRPGHIDRSLWTLERAFEIDSQNIYSFLCNDMAQAFRCIVTFDTVNRLINIYDIESYGRDTNIYLSLSHFLEQIAISPTTEDIYTVFNVEGDNELDISRVNFGSNKIVNISYPLSLLDAEIQTGYAAYLKERETYRDRYTEDSKQYAVLQEQIDAINDRQPMDIIYNNWASTTYYPTEDLEDYRDAYKAAVKVIEGLYMDPTTQTVNMDELDASVDAAMYHSYNDIAIPDIIAELAAREEGKHNTDTVEAEFIYEAYGLNDLEVRLITYQDRVTTLAEAGYSTDKRNPASSISEETWKEHHAEYLEYAAHLKTLSELIEKKQEQIAELQQKVDTVLSDMQYVAEHASLDNYSGLDEGQIAVIKSLYRESDYQDSNYGITDIDDAVSIAVKSKELYDAAAERLEIESAPQFTWTVSSANLFAMKEFAKLKDDLKVGDFVTLGFDTYGIAKFIVDKTVYKPNGIKFRVVEIDYSAIDNSGTFNVTFSDMIQTKAYRNDFETLLQNFVSSKTNAISVGASSTAASVAAQVTASIIKPYIEAQNAKIDNTLINQATIQDLVAVNANIETLVADYIQTAEFAAKIADILHLTVFDLVAADITADKSITLVSDDSGSIQIANSAMVFKDADDATRVRIGLDGNGDYTINIYSEPDEYGVQHLLFGSNGITEHAIEDHLISNSMMNWSGISAGTDNDGKPYWDSSKITVDGGRLDEKWEDLKTEVASIEIVASSQVIEDNGSVTLTPVLHLLDGLSNVRWLYKAPADDAWTGVNSEASLTAPYVDTNYVVTVPGTASKFTDDNNSLIFKASYVKDSSETHYDILTVFKLPEGSEGYTIVLSDEAQTISTTYDLYPEPETYSCTVSVYKGHSPMTPTMSAVPGANSFYVTGICDEEAVTLAFNNPGECTWTFNSRLTVPKNFQIELRIIIGGFNEVVKRYISLSAAVAGESPVTVEIDSSAGNIFKSGNIVSTLTARVTRGMEDITSECTKFTWLKYDKDGNLVESWTKETTSPAIDITPSDVQNKAVFRCEVEY